jgi:thioredoxin reductase
MLGEPLCRGDRTLVAFAARPCFRLPHELPQLAEHDRGIRARSVERIDALEPGQDGARFLHVNDASGAGVPACSQLPAETGTVSSMDAAAYDVAIIGGGAAGLSGALVLGRARRRVVVIDAGSPRNAPAAHMHGFLSRDGMPPAELLELARHEASRYGVELVSGEVVSVEPGFSIQLGGGDTIEARRLLLATGATDELPELPGVRERWGRDFLHCPYCHGWEVRDQPLGVLATGPGSVDYAQLIRQWSDDVVYFAHTHELATGEREQLGARSIHVVDGEVQQLVVEEESLSGVALADGHIIPRAALFIRPNMRPRLSGLVEKLGCELDDLGFLRVDSVGLTTAPGVWAAGNVANPRAQVITAAGEGSAAAIAINADLVQEDVR